MPDVTTPSIAGLGEFFNATDPYPDVSPCLEQLKREGYTVGIAGNQTARAAKLLQELNLPGDFMVTFDDLGAEKPRVSFFTQLVHRQGLVPSETVYVGDRFENDILPAQQAGLRGVLLRRGPWGYVNEFHPEAKTADVRISSLAERSAAISSLGPNPKSDG